MKFFEGLMIDEYLEESVMTGWDMKSFVKDLNKEFEGAAANIDRKNKTVSVYSSDKKYLDKIIKWVEYNASSKIKDVKTRGQVVEFIFESTLSEAPVGSKGWTQASIEKFGKTIGKGAQDKGFFSACVKRMEGKKGFDKEKAQGFCASIKDASFGSPMWRGKGKKKKEAQADTKKSRFKKQLPKGKK